MRLRAAFVLVLVGGSLFLGAVPAAAEGSVVGAGAPDAVADRYVVVLKPPAAGDTAAATATELAERYGGRLDQSYEAVLSGFAVELGPDAARRLAAHPAVQTVYQDRVVTAVGQQVGPPSWGLDRIDQPDLPLSNVYNYPSLAGNVHAYIVDSGFRATHTDFGGRVTLGRDYIGDGTVPGACNAHGTHVAGTVGGATYGVAKGVQLVDVRVLDCGGSGTGSDLLAAVDWITANAVKPAVVNMSLGGGGWAPLDNAVQASIASGVTYAIAAGNSNADACYATPARAPDALTVGASDSSDARASFSNYGSCLDLFAPGVSIRSAYNTSDTASAYMNGTSMATPHVAGAAALVLAASPTATPAQVRAALVGAARSGVITSLGTGSPNLLLQLAQASSEPPPSEPTPPAPTPPAPAPPVVAPPVPAPPAPCWLGFNGQDMYIRDRGAVTSPVWIGGCAGRATKASVEVHVIHPRRGDVVVELIAPNGSVRRLKGPSAKDRKANVHAVYTAKLNLKSRNGVWKLRVRDQYKGSTGYLDSWTLKVT